MVSSSPQLHSLLLAGKAGSGVTALAANAAVEASVSGNSDYVRFVTALDILTAESGGGDEARAAALVERFSEAREMQHSLLVLDDVDQILGGNGKDGYSVIMVSNKATNNVPNPTPFTILMYLFNEHPSGVYFESFAQDTPRRCKQSWWAIKATDRAKENDAHHRYILKTRCCMSCPRQYI